MARLLAFVIAAVAFATAVPADAQLLIPWYHSPLDRAGSTAIVIAVGDGREIPVVFDTGSTGLRILGGALGPNVTRTTRASQTTYADGTRLRGVYATARVRIGDVTTAPVTIEVIEHGDCDAAHPACPTVTGLGAWVKQIGGAYGILGTRAENPLAALPDPLARAFVVSRDGLTLGPDETASFATVALANDGMFTACYRLDERETCAPTAVDTGDSTIGLPVPLAQHPPARGSSLAVRAGDALDFHVASGSEASVDAVSRHGRTGSLGRPLLLQYDVLYDLGNSRVGFRRRTP